MSLKTFPAQFVTLAKGGANRKNVRILLRFLLVLTVLIVIYSVLFHVLMLREGKEHSWITGFYWTLTVMSTLGFGDITFDSDLGRGFSIIVLLSGMVFLLVLLPFTFIEFFYEPWMRAQAEARAPRRVSDATSNHVILTSFDVVTRTLIRRLEQHQWKHVIIVGVSEDALRLNDMGYHVVVGSIDDPTTYERAGVARAAMVVATDTDVTNSHVAFTVRETSNRIPIVCTAYHEASVDILQLAGANHVMRLEQMMGQSFARWTLGAKASSNVIHHVEGILVAEASPHATPLVGKTLQESRLREETGVIVVGVWVRGKFELARADTKIDTNTILVLVGTKQHLSAYDKLYGVFTRRDAPVVVLGGGRVGRATARALAESKLDYRIVEKTDQLPNSHRHIHGDAAELGILKQAGIDETRTVVITTHDDDVNVYLTIYCRKLRPDVQVIARATHERNVATLHRAGADFVLSFASMGASTIMNLLRRDKVLMVAEGLDLFRVKVPGSLAGKPIGETQVRERTQCSIVAVRDETGMQVVPDPSETLPADAEILLIGSVEAQERFLQLFRSELAPE